MLAVLVAYAFHDLMWGPLAALAAECFTPRLRYSGASIGFQLAAVFARGPAPLIATAILAATGSGQIIARYLLLVVSVAATAFLPSGRAARSEISRAITFDREKGAATIADGSRQRLARTVTAQGVELPESVRR